MSKKEGQGPMSPELVESWGRWALATRDVLALVDANDARGLAERSEEELWAAEAVASRYAGEETGTKEHQRRQSPVGYLLKRAVKADADAVLEQLLRRPAALASRGEGPSVYDHLIWELALEAGRHKAIKCLGLACRGNARLAWRVGHACLPLEGKEEAGLAPVWKDPRTKASEGWPEGYGAALREAEAADQEENWELDDGARRTLARGLMFAQEWNGAPEKHPGAMALRAAASRVERVKPGESLTPLIEVLLRAACAPVLVQEQVWALLKSIPKEHWGSDPSGPFDARALGVPARSESLPHQSQLDKTLWPRAEFGREIDPAWVCACGVVDEVSARVAGEMAIFFAGAREARPKVCPSVASMEHPLKRVWDVWMHSQRAGKALPRKPLDVARLHMEKTLHSWSERAGGQLTSPWKKTGDFVLSELGSGRVPSRFPGFESEPKTVDASRELTHAMSPAAAMFKGMKHNLEFFSWRALAATRLGFTLAQTVDQIKSDWGRSVEPAAIALAEDRELQATVAAPESHGARPSRRM